MRPQTLARTNPVGADVGENAAAEGLEINREGRRMALKTGRMVRTRLEMAGPILREAKERIRFGGTREQPLAVNR